MDADRFDAEWQNEQAWEDVGSSEDRDAVVDLLRVIEDVLDATYDDPRACSPEVQKRLRQLGAVARLLGCATEGDDVVRVRPEDFKTLGVRRQAAR